MHYELRTKKVNLEKQIIDFFSVHNEKLGYKQVAARLHIYDKEGRAEVARLLDKFSNAHILQRVGKGKYRLNPKYITNESTGRHYVTGKLEIKYSGAAFLLQEGDNEDIFIAERNQHHALPGDIVKVLLFPPRGSNRPEGEVVEIIQRNLKPLVGIIKIEKGIAFFIPDNAAYRRDILIPTRLLKKAKNGYKTVAKILEWESNQRNPVGEVLHVLGKPGDNNVEMQSILAENDLPLAFPKEVETEAEAISTEIPAAELKRRRDCRHITTFTIDPADAKDFDDALSFERLPNGNCRIGIHIADVSYYVQPGSRIDQEAYARGTSIYLVDRTIPMLPEALSNNLCSLRPHEDKLCYSAIFEMNDQAKVVKEWFGRTIINSNERFSYEEAQQILTSGEGKLSEELQAINQLAKQLRKKRFDNCAINFETEEVKFQLDENAKPIGIYLKMATEANWLIEEFMLLANQKVAELIGKKSAKNKEPKTFVYRIHDKPLEEKLSTFKNFVQKIGYTFKIGTPKALAGSFNQLFQQAKGKQEYEMLSKLSIRTMARAIYSTQNIGHYGLAFPYYTHFTSPIRRYPDLMVHRLLDAYLNQAASVNATEYEAHCNHCSQMEQRATEAERASIKYKQAEFLSDKIGQEFEATISGIGKWGVFAELKESKCEGLIPMREFTNDFYYIDEENYTLVGLHSGNSYRFGDTIRVRVTAVDMARRQMDFSLCANEA